MESEQVERLSIFYILVLYTMHHHPIPTLAYFLPRLQISRPLLTPLHPRLQLVQISRSEPTLKRFRISCQTRRNSVTLQRIQDRLILPVLRRINMECAYQSDKRGVQLPVCKMRSRAHA